MNVFFDTSVLVAASASSHPHFAPARAALKRVHGGMDKAYMSQHSIAEVFAVLTRLPVHPRISPADAARVISENILPHFDVVPLRKQDYQIALRTMENGGWTGARIYDVLILQCATTCAAERIYTFNLADFRLLAPASHSVICSP